MDTVLVDYLMSGETWLMVGSGPSNAMQYPSWRSLASTAIETAKIEALGMDLKVAEKAENLEEGFGAIFVFEKEDIHDYDEKGLQQR